MAHCMNASCRRPIADGLAFCPFCGADNRPPLLRKAVQCPGHETVAGGGACVHCGIRLAEDGTPVKGLGYRIGGILTILLGLGLASVGSYGIVYALCFPTPGFGDIGLILAAVGASLIWHGAHHVRGVEADSELFDDRLP